MAFELDGDGTGQSRDHLPDDLEQNTRDGEKLAERAAELRAQAKALSAQAKLHASLGA